MNARVKVDEDLPRQVADHMNLSALKRLVTIGEGPKLEFKRSTGELRESLQTACAFLNGEGGTVVFGVKPDGTLVGQEVSDQTLREIAQAMDGFEPPAHIETNRVIAQCLDAGIAPPEFREVAGSTVVTFRVKVGVTPQVTPQVAALLEAARQPRSREELQRVVSLKDRMHFQKAYLEPLMAVGWIEMTIPGKPRSRLQRYRTTAAGTVALQKKLNQTTGDSYTHALEP